MDEDAMDFEYFILSRGCGFVALPGWSSLTMTGKDRQAFLHNFSTNDIRRLSPGDSCEAFVTNVKGKIVGHGLVTCRETELVFITVPDQASSLVGHFERYILREDVQVRDTTSERSYMLLAGGPPAQSIVMAMAPTIAEAQAWQRTFVNASAQLVDVPLRWIRWNILGPIFCGLLEVARFDIPRARQALLEMNVGATPCGETAFHTLRVEAGTPLFGVDFDEHNFPQEVSRDREAISFTKGCYLGQETVARIDALGHVNQRLVGVRFFSGEVPTAGTELYLGDNKVGRITSATFSPRFIAPLALAMVRREANASGTRLSSPVRPCEVVALPPSNPGA